MHVRYLVSFCNVGFLPSRYSLAVVSDDRRIDFIDLGAIRDTFPLRGCTGIAVCPGGIVVALQSVTPGLAFFSPSLQLQNVVPLRTVKDVHSIVSVDGGLLIASTATNSVVRYDIETGDEETIWRIAEQDENIFHLNSVAVQGGEILVTHFGDASTADIRHGGVVNVSTGAHFAHGLREPHSLCSFGESLYVLESLTGNFFEIDEARRPQHRFQLDGYVRGLAIDGQQVCIGKSVKRMVSRGRAGAVRQFYSVQDDESSSHRRSCIYLISDQDSHALDTTSFADEIYDVALIDRDVDRDRLIEETAREQYRALRSGREIDSPALADRYLALQRMKSAGEPDPAGQAAVIEQILERSTTAEIVLEQARVRSRLGDHAGALEAARRAADIAPMDAEPRLFLGHILAAQGDWASAVAERMAAVQLNPRHAHARFQLSVAFLRLGRTGEAREAAREAVGLQPHHPPFQAWLKELSE